MLVTLDFCSLLILFLLLLLAHPVFLYPSMIVLSGIVWASFRKAKEIVKKTGELKWYFIFPLFHVIRNYSFVIGKIVGGWKHRIISI
jgi:hypothetical protein